VILIVKYVPVSGRNCARSEPTLTVVMIVCSYVVVLVLSKNPDNSVFVASPVKSLPVRIIGAYMIPSQLPLAVICHISHDITIELPVSPVLTIVNVPVPSISTPVEVDQEIIAAHVTVSPSENVLFTPPIVTILVTTFHVLPA
jgi:hypothetical protein